VRNTLYYHDGKLAYPSRVDLDRNNLKPQARSWEV